MYYRIALEDLEKKL